MTEWFRARVRWRKPAIQSAWKDGDAGRRRCHAPRPDEGERALRLALLYLSPRRCPRLRAGAQPPLVPFAAPEPRPAASAGVAPPTLPVRHRSARRPG